MDFAKHERSVKPAFVAGSGSIREVLLAFLRLGCYSFGGPIAHLGYFHAEFVERRHWCEEETFAELVGLAQSMPGPASSQVGFALGLLRAGWAGGVAAWVGFTMPSALLMLAFAMGRSTLFTSKVGAGALHGLQLVAVAVVAHAILSMRKSLAPDAPRMGIALIAAAIAFLAPPASSTVLAIAAGALCGLLLPYPPQPAPGRLHFGLPKLAGALAAATFLALLLLPPMVTFSGPDEGTGVPGSWTQGFSSQSGFSQGLAVFSAFYRTGALVFGGGHVVLPLLENAVVARGWVDQSSFLAGYGAAQALPGPLFTFSAYLGAVIQPAIASGCSLGGVAGSDFSAGTSYHRRRTALLEQSAPAATDSGHLRGVNAAVVGVLISAFIRPVCSSALHSVYDVGVAVAALVLLVRWKVAPWIIVAAVASVSAIASVL